MCFTGHIGDSNLKLISGNKELVNRIRTFQEINLDFSFSQHIFNFKMPDALYMFGSKERETGTSAYKIEYLNKAAYKLSSVCSVLLENPYIRFQGDSEEAKMVASRLKTIMDDMKIEQSWRDP